MWEIVSLVGGGHTDREGPERFRVLMACASPHDVVGGMEAVFRAVVEELRGRGHAVTEVYTGKVSEALGEQAWSLRLEPPRTRRKLPTLVSIARMCRSAASVVRLLRRVRPDLVNLHFITAKSFYWIVMRPFFRYKVVVSVHGSDVARPANAMDRALVPRLLRAADAVTVVSEALAERVREVGGPRPVVIPNGVDLAFWSPCGNGVSAEESGVPTVLAVGRLHPVKGHDVLIRAMVRVRQAVPDARLRLIGEGTARAQIEELVRDLGLDACVELLGTQPAEGVRDRLRQADVFVLPSRSEGMPISLIEAMAVGCPAVATRVGGVPEVLADGAGALVPPDDPEALADRIIHMLVDPPARAAYAERARERAEAFSWGTSGEAYHDTLLRCLSNQ